MQKRFTFANSFIVNGKAIAPPHQLPWFPDGLAWGCSDLTRPLLAKCPELKEFFSWIKVATDMVYYITVPSSDCFPLFLK
jgi:hypothetical protein